MKKITHRDDIQIELTNGKLGQQETPFVTIVLNSQSGTRHYATGPT